MSTPLQSLLDTYRNRSKTEREKGTYFEELIRTYFRHEPFYADLYSDVWLYHDWARLEGKDARDVGIDLVAKTKTGEYCAIQCKFYAQKYKVKKSDIDSFFTASGQAPFTQRIIVTTTIHWTEHADSTLMGQNPPVTKIDLQDLEASQIDWSQYQPGDAPIFKPKKEPRPHQINALNDVKIGLTQADRGKLLMACGTGKTFTSLKIVETLAGKNKRVLFLVPSLALLSQTLTEWTQESETPLHSFAVCSDSDVGKKRKKDDDRVETFIHELRYSATTSAARLAQEMAKRHDANHMSCVFGTYHSIGVIHQAQHQHDLAPFDLIICDEAHRTTGATFTNEDDSNFVKIHDADYIQGKKRLYMTATPRIYGDTAKVSEEKGEVVLYSMDDPEYYGQDLHTLTFSEAVNRGLLVDYKVIILTMDEAHISRRLQNLLKDENNSLKVDDAAKIVGCWKALSKHQTIDAKQTPDPDPMRRAVAFCQVIEPGTGKAKTHKVSSKQIADMFQAVVQAYQEHDSEHGILQCEAEHVDGSMNASQKEAKLAWLRAKLPENTCRILSNVRCLSEGVDVPALDAVLFLTPRNSQVDVVQSVGRVMRNAPDKTRGYVILPVVIPEGMKAHEALADNKIYKVVWEVLQALRSHDDRFDAMINKMDLTGAPPNKMEVIAINDQAIRNANRRHKSQQEKLKAKAQGGHSIGIRVSEPMAKYQTEIEFTPGEVERAIYAKIVEKCGRRTYWEDWANDIARIAGTHITRIRTIVENRENKQEQKAFRAFVAELRDDLNPAITEAEVIEMLAQHLITQPVFEALFEGYSFAQNNPVSQGMQQVLDLLHEHHLEKEADTLEGFYASVRMRAEGIDNTEGKQRIVLELYDKFFRNAFPRMTERLGIVYTPVEVVDFIIHSIDHLLQTEFGQTLGSHGVHILDPFTGTGTFITRLLQSGLITKDQLPHKYQHEIHANEIVLLAYYIAAINIEAAYHGQMGGQVNSNYQPFKGICLTDTFQMHEQDDLIQEKLKENSERRMRQKGLKEIRVIMGNPPYSAGQESANDNNQNIRYPLLDERVRTTYVARTNATLRNALYDSYIRAIRWASDRIGDSGIIGFVTNAGFLEANTADGLRQCLAEEFTSLYIFHLRGNQRTSGELSRKEGGKIFGSGSRAPIAISLLVKNPDATQPGQIRLHDIGDYLTQEQKLKKIAEFGNVAGITKVDSWQNIIPDQHGDWLNQRDESFGEYIVLGDKKGGEPLTLFENYSNGVKTNRDAWVYNHSRSNLIESVRGMVDFYNHEVNRYKKTCAGLEGQLWPKVDDFINLDSTKMSWTREVRQDLGRHKNHCFSGKGIYKSLYRPF
uniref:Predicted helicase n=1 Tax=Candidatus Kentrum sp. TUN TaxID=2126343 RepID=A0A450ZGM8_9GAMM|nr:MAG: Predicted helicase [Candidatus Kentron sp. TUN]VFK52946.1 MAG: Predicted helicase [Candidatus Kentron sp. TUN]